MTSIEPSFNQHQLNLEMENHQLKKDLRERQFKQFTLSKIQQVAKVGTWKLNHLTYDVCLSPELLNMLGLTKTSCKLKWNEFVNLIDPEKCLALETQLIQLEDVEHPAIVHTFLDDKLLERHFKHFSHTFTNSIGQPLRTVGLIQGITEEFNQATELERQAITDELTKLYNRRKINRSLRELINDSANTGMPFSVMLFDLDHFKRVNDVFGHTFGDEMLMATADIMRKFLLSYAQYGRWGGEEFLIVVKNVSLTDACNIAKHIKNTLNTIIFPNNKPLSASFGVTQFKGDDNFTTILTRVDQLMYKAKQSGRNLVVCG
ncbi:hypothetical protein CWB73_01380 [Pseudoalteromonas phenolica]|uniref:diguanylate cyclase n=1 Tax=Pseudoalteromonas phenolica TaxID=161398 RepID=A0A5S3YYM0_9GAMM|nr:GGDEF domain-containing protein [Pseudoalteromonas phenolica]TMP83828.1 hypothetical protein CWB73_01380 [Pseudoalteromonas phenolica]